MDFYLLREHKTIGDAYKTVHQFAHKNKLAIKNDDNIEDYFVNFDKNCYFDKSIKLILADALKRDADIIEALRSEDERLVRRALACSWFFAAHTDCEFYDQQIFNTVSIYASKKILGRLCHNVKSEVEAEKFFSSVRDRLGRNEAEVFLPQCSKPFILEYLHSFSLKRLSAGNSNVIIRLFKKYPDIVTTLIESKESRSKKLLIDLFKYLFDTNKELFFKLYETYFDDVQGRYDGFKLGHRRLRTLVLQYKDKIINQPKFFISLEKSNRSIIFKYMTSEERYKLFINYVRYNSEPGENGKAAPSLHDWKAGISLFLDHIRKWIAWEERFMFLTASFQELFNKNLLDCSQFWDDRILKLAPYNVRESCIEKKQQTDKHFDINAHLHMYHTTKSIPKLKELLFKESSPHIRQQFLCRMVSSCAINRDLVSLKEVIELLINRYRNDDVTILSRLMNKTLDQFPHKCFEPQHWSLLEDLNKILELRKEKNWTLEKKKWMKKQFQGMLTTEDFQLFYSNRFELRCFKNNKMIAESLVAAACNYPDAISRKVVFICNVIITWNCRHKNNVIRVNDTVMQLIHDYIQSEKSLLDYFITWEDVRDKLDPNILFNNCNVNQMKTLLNHYYKTDPSVINIYFSQICDLCLKKPNEAHIWCNIKMLEYLNLKEKLINLYVGLIKQNKASLVILRQLSLLMSPEAFADLTKEFIPASLIIDYNEANNINETRVHLACSIRTLSNGPTKLQLISKFLGGDYLKYIIGALMNTTNHCNIQTVKQFLNANSDSPISVKKNILRCSAEVLSLSDKLKFFTKLWERETHYSIQTVIFIVIRDCFYEQKSKQVWEVLKKLISESSDPNILASFPTISHIPDRFLNEFVLLLWQHKSLRNELLNSISMDIMEKIDDNFILSAINEYLITENECYSIYKFTINYLVFVSREAPDFPDFMFIHNLFLQCKDKTYIRLFFSKINYYILDYKGVKSSLISVLIQLREQFLETYKFFNEYLTLKLIHFFLICKEKHKPNDYKSVPYQFGVELKYFLNSLDNSFELMHLVADCVTDIVSNESDLKVGHVIDGLLGDMSDRKCNILAAQLLRFVPSSSDDDQLLLNDLMSRIHEHGDTVVIALAYSTPAFNKKYINECIKPKYVK